MEAAGTFWYFLKIHNHKLFCGCSFPLLLGWPLSHTDHMQTLALLVSKHIGLSSQPPESKGSTHSGEVVWS